nr:HAD domain-containing protein [uncultured Albidiferax sp.]
MTTKPFKPDERQKRIVDNAKRLAEDAALRGRYAPDELVQRMTLEAEGVRVVSQIAPVEEPLLRPTVFLDIDDVLCLNLPYGGLDVQRAAAHPGRAPDDLYLKVFSPSAIQALNALIFEFEPKVVLTTSWLKLLQREHFIDLFSKTGVSVSGSSLHERWDAPQDFGTSRMDAIERWLKQNHRGESIVVLDDHASGEGLVGSLLHEAGYIVLCEVDVGFNSSLLQAARDALLRPFDPAQPWLR